MDTTGLLSSVEGWVVQTACAQLAWLNASLNLPSPLALSINLSEKQMRQPNLHDLVRQALEVNQIASHLLWLEVTEQSEVKNMEAVYSIFEGFRSMGIKVCLDDFGTGHSTLGHLNTFPLDILKIDKSFVQKVNSEPGQAKLVKTMIGLGKNLDLRVVAEGVETQQQLSFLRQTDCNYAQGYYFSRPLDVVDIEALLKKNPSW
jgi:EAL domain-containing protein (putative c-di-GMP-specific phosphodiesterase class I)